MVAVAPLKGSPEARGINYASNIASMHGGVPARVSSSLSTSESGQFYDPDQKARINQLYPELYSRFLQHKPGDFNQYVPYGGTQNPYPNIPIVQAFTPQQVAKQTNTYFSDAASRTGTEQRGIEQQLGGRGFGSMSPLSLELAQAAQGRNYRTANDQATQFELGAAEKNADLALRSWLARLQGAELSNADDVRRRQLSALVRGQDIERENALARALAFYTSPLSKSSSTSFSADSQVNPWSLVATNYP